uniref:RloB domain-containing protein n=1 Tax=Magnetococcus massalia (strain MO-1) TaxID=451514 RepID=A0A1S7LC73_MAGMO|nr:Conserved protein of unknown function [Candidatus Magnetococcus massalia]
MARQKKPSGVKQGTGKRNSNRFSARSTGKKELRKRFVISGEGCCTETQYFQLLETLYKVVIDVVPHDDTNDPRNVRKRLTTWLDDRENRLKGDDEAWIVVDRDRGSWSVETLNEILNFTRKNDSYHLALSNPRIEYWLLLHHEECKGVTDSNLDHRLKKHVNKKDLKNIHLDDYTHEKIVRATREAKARTDCDCTEWPDGFGQSTLYCLIERILKAHKQANFSSETNSSSH